MSDETLNRRDFFKRAATIGAAVTGAGTLLAACKKGGGGGEKSGGGGGGEADKKKEALSCTDTSGLKKSEIETREKRKYVDNSDKPDQNCANCQLFQAPDKEGTCGSCTVVPGPINPQGWCNQWVKKQS